MGVTKQGKKWIARVSWEGEQLYLGRKETKELAEKACEEKLKLLSSGLEKPKRGKYRDLRGISRDGKFWIVLFRRKKKKYYLGRFNTEKEAIEVRDIALDKLRRGEPVDSVKRKTSSIYPGVTWCRKSLKWRAYYTYPKGEDGKYNTTNLGYYSKEDEAKDERDKWIKENKRRE